MISAGWNWSGPAPSQRRAPLIRTPKPGIEHEQQQHEGDDEQQRRDLPDLVEAVRASRTCITARPTAPYIDVLDEVRRPVALALEQRPRRRGRVDHHRPAGQQAERGGQQQSVLERLLPGPGHQSARFDAAAPPPSRLSEPRGRAP